MGRVQMTDRWLLRRHDFFNWAVLMSKWYYIQASAQANWYVSPTRDDINPDSNGRREFQNFTVKSTNAVLIPS